MIDPLDAALDELFGAPGTADQDVPEASASDLTSACFCWDIETGPQPWAAVKKFYSPPAAPGAFDPDSVKTGNLGAEKAAAKVEAARLAHEQAVEAYDLEALAHRKEWHSCCSLSPMTGRVICSQYLLCDHDNAVWIDEAGESESDLLERLWERVEFVRRSRGKIVGYNLAGFDVPFCLQRSWILGVSVPQGLFWRNRYLNECFVDLFDVWRAGRMQKWSDAAGYKLDEVARACGLDGKTGDGADFYKLYSRSKTRAKALEYARQDVRIVAGLARRLGVLE